MWVTQGPRPAAPGLTQIRYFCHARMLLLFLLAGAWGALAASLPGLPDSLTLRLLQTTVFHNANSTDTEMMALLGDLETHSLNCSTFKIRFFQPWAQQGLTPKEWQDLELVAHRYLTNFIILMTKAVKDEGAGYPLVAQWSVGCKLQPNNTSRQFCDAAVNGEDFISFDVATGTWIAQRGDKLALNIWDFLSRDKGTSTMIQFLLNSTCVHVIKSFAQYGKESLERQERPVGVVFARVPAPARTTTSLLLVCWVTGFYPRPIHVAWLLDGNEVAPKGMLNSTGILPNADLTYQLRSSLAVEPDDGHSYACRVEHISLGGHSLLIPWRHSRRWQPGPAAVLGSLAGAAALVAGLWWRRRRRGYHHVGRGVSSA